MKAFEVLDKDSKGFLTADELRQFFIGHGESFALEEVEKLLDLALDPTSKTVQYKSFLHYLTINKDALSISTNR